MECPQKTGDGVELIIAYAARTLDSQTELVFEQHLQSCASCQKVAAAQRTVWSALDELKPLPVSSNFDEKLYQRIAQENQAGWWQRLLQVNWSWRPAIPVAVACAILITAFMVKNFGSGSAAQTTVQPKVQIEQVERALDDMDMLKQVGVEPVLDTSAPRERI